MNITLEIVKSIIPSIIVLTTAYLLIKEFLKKEEKKMKHELFLANQKEISPIRLQAYERLIIFLERIHPESMIIRENQAGLNNQQLQQKLIHVIRTEFEHNIAQQLYVSDKLWSQIKMTKDNMIQIINSESSKLSASNSSIELGKAVIEANMKVQSKQINLTIAELKSEIKIIWNN
jgi:hypothetical protein